MFLEPQIWFPLLEPSGSSGFPDLRGPREVRGVRFAQIVHLLQDGASRSLDLPVQRQECGGTTRRQASTAGEEEGRQTRPQLGVKAEALWPAEQRLNQLEVF